MPISTNTVKLKKKKAQRSLSSMLSLSKKGWGKEKECFHC